MRNIRGGELPMSSPSWVHVGCDSEKTGAGMGRKKGITYYKTNKTQIQGKVYVCVWGGGGEQLSPPFRSPKSGVIRKTCLLCGILN